MDFTYFKENDKLIATDLSKKTKLKAPQEISFIGKLENQANGATVWKIGRNYFWIFAKFCKHLIKNGST